MTNLKTQLDADLKEALKQHDALKVSTLRMAKSALKYLEIDKRRDLTDDEVLGVLDKEGKKRKESIAEFQKGNRPDLVAKEQAEFEILARYLPTQLSEAEIRTLVHQVIAGLPPGSPPTLSQCMPKIMPLVKGRADGKLVNRIVQEALAR